MRSVRSWCLAVRLEVDVKKYPLLFSRRELVEGNGFIAAVVVNGSALLSEEDGEVWVEGVSPGGFSSDGLNHGDALAKFCAEYRAVLYDIAADTADFEAFKKEVQAFFDATNETALAEWAAAVVEVRAGGVEVDWLTRRSADSKLSIEVQHLHQFAAENNTEGEASLAA